MTIKIKVMLTNGNNWTTGFNGTLEEAKHYYLGTFFETSDELHEHECVSVELV
jgi:hypothetical protein